MLRRGASPGRRLLRLGFLASGSGVGLYLCADGPGFPEGGEFLDLIRLRFGEVQEFGPILTEVVEFPGRITACAYEFEIADAYSGIAFMFPVQGFALDGLVGERWE